LRDCGRTLRGRGQALRDCGRALRACGQALRGCRLTLCGRRRVLRSCGQALRGCGPVLRGCGQGLWGCGLLAGDHPVGLREAGAGEEEGQGVVQCSRGGRQRSAHPRGQGAGQTGRQTVRDVRGSAGRRDDGAAPGLQFGAGVVRGFHQEVAPRAQDGEGRLEFLGVRVPVQQADHVVAGAQMGGDPRVRQTPLVALLQTLDRLGVQDAGGEVQAVESRVGEERARRLREVRVPRLHVQPALGFGERHHRAGGGAKTPYGRGGWCGHGASRGRTAIRYKTERMGSRSWVQ
jgi:hypothetical protein